MSGWKIFRQARSSSQHPVFKSASGGWPPPETTSNWRGHAADPETLAFGGGNLVADALGGYLAFELEGALV